MLGNQSYGIGIATAVLLCSAPTLGRTVHAERHAGSTEAHRYLGTTPSPTTSWVDRSVTWAEAGRVEFDYFVDSEPGGDRLVLLLDGSEVWSLSGRHQIGRAQVPVGPGAHTLRFAYVKNEQVNMGLDRAWVDDVELFAGADLFQRHEFRASGGLDGWTPGGYGGGWGLVADPPLREIRTPKAISGLGYSATPQRAGIRRSFTWPTAEERELLVGYFVDSEPEHDELRILIDGVMAFAVSGRMKYGRARIPIASSGSHEITIEYLKDESVDEGLDLARILQIEAKADGQRFERIAMASASLGTALDGWTTVGDFPSDPWYVIQGEASRIVAMPSDVLSGLDGLATATEVPPQAMLRFPINGLSDEHSAQASLMASAELAHTVYLQLRLRKGATAAFLAGGGLRVMLDAQPWHSILVDGCGRYSTSPGPSSRLLEITLGASGEPTLTAQFVGACWDGSGSPWRATNAGEEWPAAFWWTTGDEPPEQEGALILAVTLPEALDADLEPTAAVALSLLGSANGGPVAELGRIPWRDEIAFDEGDVATWEELRLGVLHEDTTTYSAALTDAMARER